MNELFLATALYLVKAHVLLSGLAILTFVFFRGARFSNTLVSMSTARRGLHALIVIACLAPLVMMFVPRPNVFRAPVQIFEEASISRSGTRHQETTGPVLVFNGSPTTPAASEGRELLRWICMGVLLITGVSLLYRGAQWGRDVKRLRRLVARSDEIKLIGRVRIALSREAAIPFSARAFGRAQVIVPFALLKDWGSVRLAIAHELQHHRQLDLHWLALLESVRAAFGWNPLVRALIARAEELQELACDETLLGRRGFDNHAYATCLFEVARTATGFNGTLRGTAGMAVAPEILKRRIEMALHSRKNVGVWTARAATVMVAVLLATAAWAAEGVVADRRISLRQAQELAREAHTPGGVKLVVTPEVLAWLNKATSTPQARFYLRGVFKRMKTYEPMIRRKLAAANLPQDLLAVPIIESGYQNIAGRNSAGLWQFIPDTARVFGLRVDDAVDERYNEEKLTDAAVAYYTKLNREFGDWHAALLAYNSGEHRLRSEMKAAGHRDVLRLLEEGRFNKEVTTYLPKVLASIIILKNPELARD